MSELLYLASPASEAIQDMNTSSQQPGNPWLKQEELKQTLASLSNITQENGSRSGY